MKRMLMEAAGLVGGMTLLGYFYMKKHPDMMKEMKKNIKEMSRIVYNKLDMED